MPGGLISGGPSKRHRLPDSDGQIASAEQGLAARTIRGTTGPVPPPAPLPTEFLDDPPEGEETPLSPMLRVQRAGAYAALAALGGPQEVPYEPPLPESEQTITPECVITFGDADVRVTFRYNRREYSAAGGSLVEALSIAAGEFEAGLQQPVCPHCGQLMPTEG